ncbi:MAG TPA: hypothetical protein VK023_05110 [Sphingobacterium bovisgrunnientis]|jgi:hypothetical protein|nr:hypothetical protein [Sphingobacterium bovisgrunnientis]
MSDHIENLKEKADKEAIQYTDFMVLADIYNQPNPAISVGEYLLQLQENKAEEKSRILNEIITTKRSDIN